MRNAEAAHQLLEKVANGFAPLHDASEAQAVFNDLLEHEAYDTFVDVFNAYNDIRAKNVCAPGELPFKPTLTLQLPGDWRPVRGEDFLKALGQVTVERLEIAPSRFSTKLAIGDEGRATVPHSVCEGMCALLRRGTTELAVRGALDTPQEVAHALSCSKLLSLEMGESVGGAALTKLERHTYEALMDGVALSQTLHHLSFRQPELVELHAKLKALADRGVPLTSIDVVGRDHQDLKSFVEVLKSFKQLTAFSLDCKDLSGRTLVNSVLAPLAWHSTLYRLDIVAPSASLFKLKDLGVAPYVLNFAGTCPSLRHLKLQAGPADGRGEQPMGWINGSESPSVTQTHTDFARTPRLHLESLTMIGVVFTSAFMSVFRQMLAHNDTLVYLNFLGSQMSITEALKFPGALESNAKLRHCLLPNNPECYFFEYDDLIHLINSEFEVVPHGYFGDAMKSLLEKEFAKIRKDALTVSTATQALLDHRHGTMEREALTSQERVRSQELQERLPSTTTTTTKAKDLVTTATSTAAATLTVTTPTGRTTSNTTATTNTTDTRFTPPPEEDPGSPTQG